ncbi:OmpA family protein [Curvivirga aplysinae]|uniref:OmpA family protein n=1 Tax=Curvivirga aplysinae TaxID=2529852 RepID=UPI001C3F633C|nr:OmpA family protein [Curvivirga aplysinae]
MKKIQILAVSTAILLSLNACTNTTQDVVDGVSGGWFSDSTEEEDQSIPGEDEEFPAVGTVPERPEEPELKRDFDALQSGLVADNQNAQYSDQVIRSQSIPTNETPIQAPQPVQEDVSAPATPPVASSETVAKSATTTAPSPVAEAPKPAPTPVEPKITSKPSNAVAVPVATTGQSTSNVAQVAPKPVEPAPAPVPATPAPAVEAAKKQVVVRPTVSAQNTDAGTVVDVPNVQASEEAVAAISANRAEEAASNGTHIATLYYSIGNAVLSANDKAVLGQVADLYVRNGATGVAIIGHASIPVSPRVTNPALVNYKVSLDRAVNVTETLKALGVPADMILMDARGANDPARLGDTDLDHAYNRRAEIYFLN